MNIFKQKFDVNDSCKWRGNESLQEAHSKAEFYDTRGNKFRFWETFVEALDEFPSYFIQAIKTCTSTSKYP